MNDVCYRRIKVGALNGSPEALTAWMNYAEHTMHLQGAYGAQSVDMPAAIWLQTYAYDLWGPNMLGSDFPCGKFCDPPGRAVAGS